MDEKSNISTTYVLDCGLYNHPIKDCPRLVLTPVLLNPMDDKILKNRLGLSQWLIRNDNPLTSCVFVNRFWQQIFRNRIIKTSEYFGLQSEFPSHPNLLDYIAVRFQETS